MNMDWQTKAQRCVFSVALDRRLVYNRKQAVTPLEITRRGDAYEFDRTIVVLHVPCRVDKSDCSDKSQRQKITAPVLANSAVICN